MLSELHIENLGVIERLDLVLGTGLTALTGETGAGKTMLIEAIELLVGGRADASIVRRGAGEARIEGRFVGPDGTERILGRVVPSDGRSRAYLDGRLATVTSLAEAANGMVDLHGQHAHQSLLSTSTQRDALDRFGTVDLEPLRAARARLTEIDAALAALGGDERLRAREIDLLRFQVAELDAAGIDDANEDDALDVEESMLADAVGHRDAGATAHDAMSAEGGARDAVGRALAALDKRQPFESVVVRLRDVLAELDDLIAVTRDLTDSIDESPDRLDEVRERRQLLADLRRKYGDDLEEVMQYHSETEDRLRELESYEERAAELDAQRRDELAAERSAAVEVGRARRAAAEPLARAVEERLRLLAMPHAEVAVEVGEHADDHPGDRVRFLLAANPGLSLLPLNRVASGGELARSMLALRLVLAGADLAGSRQGADVADTLVFDEVDAGIGGEAAQAVGEALSALAEHHQVLVVTHLAQVAALADAQISVSKVVQGGATYATAEVLEGDDRVDEIARMLSGSTSASALDHARELLA
ncbi:DNA repair protein RecN [Ilumatobacter nonamiensis]|uniref:DNA repair protein RecN n=1 Tax=Ilumatobacter nonamiensis TaxID=467093 RepID=UPI000346F89E|nr:DNA repair protein RecN [Ilumatobacter nonamiensis]